MDQQDWLADRFEQHRPRLRAVSYRMLGSLSEADDAVQEAWLRFSSADTSEVEDLGAWLTTVVARICLNALRSRKTRREEPIGPHMPDPIVSAVDAIGPEDEALIADSVGLALLDRARHARSRRTAGVRPARRVRRAVRADRSDHRSLRARHATAREPRAPPSQRDAHAGRGHRRAVGARRRIPRRRSRRRLRQAPHGARSRRRAPRRRRRDRARRVANRAWGARRGLGRRQVPDARLRQPSRAGQRRARRRVVRRGRAVLSGRIHRRTRQDRRDEHPGRPRAPAAVGSGSRRVR